MDSWEGEKPAGWSRDKAEDFERIPGAFEVWEKCLVAF
jgi:hypothetical protein